MIIDIKHVGVKMAYVIKANVKVNDKILLCTLDNRMLFMVTTDTIQNTQRL